MQLPHLISLLAFLPLAVLAQCPPQATDYATVTLPYGTVQATDCDETLQVYTFRNIPFGKDTSLTRFQSPSFPDHIANAAHHQLDQSGSHTCPQVQVPSSKTSSLEGPSFGEPILAPPEGTIPTEDCLYLDLYVPISAINKTASLPVIVWFYGGAFLIGSKDAGGSITPLYSGLGPIGAAQSLGQNAIFIAGNYRLGAFGWLAGPEFTTAGGTPNAGLLDQRLLLKWIQINISLFGGNKSQVSAWGQSAGGGSIMHHMIASWTDEYPGDPLFKRAILMSAAYQWKWNNTPSGNLDIAYNQFLNDALTGVNCTEPSSFSCLQGLSTSQLANANQQLFETYYANGIFDIGPSVDGTLLKELPPITLTSCKTNCAFQKVESIIASHVNDESFMFVPKYVTDESSFNTLVEYFLPGNATLQQKIETAYWDASLPAFTNAENMIRDAVFTCNVHWLFQGLQSAGNKVFLADYDVWSQQDFAVHGMDLFTTFWNHKTSETVVDGVLYKLFKKLGFNWTKLLKYIPKLGKDINSLHSSYQSYFVHHALTGDPNYASKLSSNVNPVTWLEAQDQGGSFTDVLLVNGPSYSDTPYAMGPGANDSDSTCSFWLGIANSITKTDNTITNALTEGLYEQHNYMKGTLEL